MVAYLLMIVSIYKIINYTKNKKDKKKQKTQRQKKQTLWVFFLLVNITYQQAVSFFKTIFDINL